MLKPSQLSMCIVFVCNMPQFYLFVFFFCTYSNRFTHLATDPKALLDGFVSVVIVVVVVIAMRTNKIELFMPEQRADDYLI